MVTIYRDIKLRLTPRQWIEFSVPHGVTVVWDRYNFKEKSVVGRFVVSENHLDPDSRKNEIFLEKLVDSLGEYVISENARNKSLDGVRFGEFSSTWMGHPYTKDLPNDVDIHIAEHHNTATISKKELEDINLGIKHESYTNPNLKKYRDERFKPKERSDGNYDVYVGVLEEIP